MNTQSLEQHLSTLIERKLRASAARARSRARVRAFCERMRAEGRLAPAHLDSRRGSPTILDALMLLTEGEAAVRKFGERDLSPVEVLMDVIRRGPAVYKLAETKRPRLDRATKDRLLRLTAAGTKAMAGRPKAAAASGAEALDVPDYRQAGDYDCGAAATHAVCSYFNVGPQTEADFIRMLGTTPADGTDPTAILQALSALGLSSRPRANLTLQDLAADVAEGRPVICCVQAYGTPAEERAEQSGHYVVVLGVNGQNVTIQDPSAGRRTVSAEDFLANWRDRGADGTEYLRYGIAVGGGEGAAADAVFCGGKGSGKTGPCPSGDGEIRAAVAEVLGVQGA